LTGRIELRQGSILTTLTSDERYDLIVSNPPYVRQTEWEALSPEVRDFEPKISLVAGPDGLLVLRDLIDHAPEYLRPGGWLIVEFGIDHADPLTRLVEEDGRYGRSEIIADDARIPRLLAVQTSIIV
jgi:release factor glutamine methyltransferase